MLALQYNVFIHDVDKLISLNSQLMMTKGRLGMGGVSFSSLLISLHSQLLMTKGGWGGGGESYSSLLISFNSQLLMIKGGWGGGGVSSSSLLISQTKLIAAQQWNGCMPAQLKLVPA